ncbi:MAG: cobyrinate a,c-diamide synthase [Nitrospirota bacterium]
MHGIVIAGTHSGCGKTTTTLGILAALKKKGLNVQSFKAGPDFIDAGLHKIITGRPSINLDLWMCGEDYVRSSYNRHSAGSDVSVIEGVMGLYDGRFSTATLAKALNLPVLLVVDAYGMAESAGAVVKGYAEFGVRNAGYGSLNSELRTPMGRRPNSELFFAGVIFNRVASENHFKRLKESVHDIPVLGYLPRDLSFEIPHRHLGLTTAEETPISEENIQKLADTILRHVDIDAILKLSSNITVLSFPPYGSRPTGHRLAGHRLVEESFPEEGLRRSSTSEDRLCRNDRTAKIALAYDKAFSFYYEDNLNLLKEAGADIIRFSPISDKTIPEGVDAIYIGGGYPELYAEELSKNEPMLRSISDWAESGKPLYAECGGLMFLSQGIYDFDGRFFRMSGVFPFETAMSRGRSKIGYREIVLKGDCILGRKGESVRGHEFHYSEVKIEKWEVRDKIYSLYDNSGNKLGDEGYASKNTLASYVHVHFGSCKNIAENFAGFRGNPLPDVSRSA